MMWELSPREYHYWRLYIPTGEELEDTVKCDSDGSFLHLLDNWNRPDGQTGNWFYSPKPVSEIVLARLKGGENG